MPFTGPTYTAPSNSWNPAVSGTTISSSDWAALLADLSTALSSVPPYGIAQANAYRFGGIAGGTANAITVSLTPAITAYTNGLTLWFFSGAAANSGATTLAVNGLTATAVQLAGAALTGGEIAANRLYMVTFYNSVFHLNQPSAQAPLNITSTAAGTLLTLTSTDAGAAVGPDIVTLRSSATPAANDLLGGFQMNGKDSAGNTETYAYLIPQIDDPTNGSEDSTLIFRTRRAGASVDMNLTGGGWSAAGAADKGSGTANMLGLYVAGHGTIAQVVRNTNVTYTTCGTIMPYDNSIPQITEGDEVLSVAITPTNASSILRIRVNLPVVGSGAAQMISAALFVDATANALAVGCTRSVGGSAAYNISFEFSVSAASTSARTYRVRMGAAGATDAFLNGDDTARMFGGVAMASLEVEEILPQ